MIFVETVLNGDFMTIAIINAGCDELTVAAHGWPMAKMACGERMEFIVSQEFITKMMEHEHERIRQ